MRHCRHIGILLIALLTAWLLLSACSASPAPTATPTLAPTAASTPTPAPTNTPLPTATATPRPSPTPTEVPSPTPEPSEPDETWIDYVNRAAGFSLRCPDTWHMASDSDLAAAFVVDTGSSADLVVIALYDSDCFDGSDNDEAMACFTDEFLSTVDDEAEKLIDSGVWDDGVHQGHYAITKGNEEAGVVEAYLIALPNEEGNTILIGYSREETSPPREQILETLRGVSASAMWGLPITAVSTSGWETYLNEAGNWSVKHPSSWVLRSEDDSLTHFVSLDENGLASSISISPFDGACTTSLDDDATIACFADIVWSILENQGTVEIADSGPWDDGVNSGCYVLASIDRPGHDEEAQALMVFLRDDAGLQSAFQFLYTGPEGTSPEQLKLLRTVTSTFVRNEGTADDIEPEADDSNYVGSRWRIYQSKGGQFGFGLPSTWSVVQEDESAAIFAASDSGGIVLAQIRETDCDLTDEDTMLDCLVTEGLEAWGEAGTIRLIASGVWEDSHYDGIYTDIALLRAGEETEDITRTLYFPTAPSEYLWLSYMSSDPEFTDQDLDALGVISASIDLSPDSTFYMGYDWILYFSGGSSFYMSAPETWTVRHQGKDSLILLGPDYNMFSADLRSTNCSEGGDEDTVTNCLLQEQNDTWSSAAETETIGYGTWYDGRHDGYYILSKGFNEDGTIVMLYCHIYFFGDPGEKVTVDYVRADAEDLSADDEELLVDMTANLRWLSE